MRAFSRDEDGSLLIFGVYIFVLILMVGGIGIDLMRFERDRAELQYTLDRAVLAAADLDQQLAPSAVVQDYFDKADLGGYLTGVTVSQGSGFRTVSATANAEVATQFMHMTGLDTLNAPAAGTAEELIGAVEVSLVLDVSGSMSSSNRLANLKVAAKAFIDKLIDQSRAGAVSISIVPYATQVNVGEAMLSKFNATQEHDYSHCVNFISDQFSRTTLYNTEILERTAHFDPFTYSTDPIAMPVCPVRPGTAIVPVTNDKAVLQAAINAMTAGGNTSIDMGVKWGVALLDPSLQPVIDSLADDGVVPAEFRGKPLNYNSGENLKVLVVMSDGQNTDQYYLNPSMREGLSNVWYNAQADKYSVYHDQGNTRYFWPSWNVWRDYPYGNDPSNSQPGTAVRLTYPELLNRVSLAWNARYNYYFTSSAWAEWYSSAFSKRETAAKDAFTKNICSAAKTEDIIVFAIGFEAPRAGVKVLKDCASSAAHYFDAEGLSINDAFDSISSSIRKLRLTQ